MEHFGIIIIGSGAGGGTLALKLAPTGKRILIVDRRPYAPREKENWSVRFSEILGKDESDKWPIT